MKFRLGWAEPDLQGHRKGDGRKASIAARLRRETTMTLAWIAERLHMGAPGHVACLFYRNDPEAGGSENKLTPLKAERLIAEALRGSGATEQQLTAWRKGHRFKVKLAAKRRAETTVTVSWIAKRLAMGSRGHLAHLLYRNGETRSDRPESNPPCLEI